MSWSLLLFFCAMMKGIVNGADNLGFDTVSTLTELNEKNFDSYVLKDDKPWAVLFFAPWCYFSQQIAPHWKKTSKNLQGVVRMGYVNAPDNPSLEQRFNVDGYPTVYMFFGDKSNPKEYEGEDTEEEMTNTFSSLVNKNGGKRAEEEKPQEGEEIHEENEEDKIPNENEEEEIQNENEGGNISNEFTYEGEIPQEQYYNFPSHMFHF